MVARLRHDVWCDNIHHLDSENEEEEEEEEGPGSPHGKQSLFLFSFFLGALFSLGTFGKQEIWEAGER